MTEYGYNLHKPTERTRGTGETYEESRHERAKKA